MNLESIKALATSKLARQALLAQKHSPKALFVVGVVGVVGATVLACRATLKMDDVLENHEATSDRIDNLRMDATNRKDDAELHDLKTRENKLKLKTGLEIAKLYALPVGLGAASILALTGSQVILTKRNTAAMAAFAAMDRAYKEYRQRVSEEYGPSVDRKFATGAETIEVTEKTAEGKTVKKKVDVVTGRYGRSPYAVLFDQVNSRKFSTAPGINTMILATQQSHANNKLRAYGHLFLNEVYDMLGLPRTPEGQIVGWIYRRDNEEKNGDNYVSFGVWDGDREGASEFVNGDELSIWLDFNVDGSVWELIGKEA